MAYPHIETKADYEEYKKAVEEFFKTEEIETFTCGSLKHNYDNPEECTGEDHLHDSNSDYECEPYFSYKPCDCCLRSLGGMRHDVIANHPTAGILEYSVCDDCVYYNEYGKLDDLTMLNLKEK